MRRRTGCRPFLDWPGPIPFAHRGGAGDWPENTMPAFQGAVALGYRYVETDVHATSDGVLVAFHDDRLDRVTDRKGLIREQRWSAVAAARVDSREPIPRLEDLFTSFPALRINIDPKHDTAVEPLARAIREADALDRVCIGSFSDRRLARLREMLGPRLATSLGPAGVARLRAASIGLPVGRFRTDCAQVPARVRRTTIVDERFVRAAHRWGVDVHVWTVDAPHEMDRLLDLGVDGLMTDRPAVLRDVLVRRGEWYETG